MLERIREGSQGPWAMVIIALIVLSFVFAGVNSYISGSGATAAAVVNGEEVSQQDLDRAYQSQRARMESQYGEGISALFSDENYLRDFRRSVLDRLIGDTLIEQKARELGLRVSDKQVRDTIVQMPEFQTDGQFDNDRYKMLLRQNGFQPADFSQYLRVQMTKEQLSRALTASDFTLDSEIQLASDLQQQTRDAEYLIIDSAPFNSEVEVTDADIESYYQSNLSMFDTQELVKVAYVELTVDSLKDDVTVTDKDVAAFYEDNKAIYTTQEERRVSHILVEFGDDEAAAKAKAEALLAQIKDGADFAELAKAESADTFSAENGGDLEFISHDMMDPAFDEAAFALASVGDVSEVVRSDFGFHIIKMTDIKPESQTPLAEVAAEIKAQLITEKATDLFFEQQNTMAQIAFEVPDTLQDVAGAIDGEVKETTMFSRNDVPANVDVPDLVNAVFSPELIEEGLNSELIEDGNERVIVARVIDHEPQRTKALDEVRESITARLRAEKAQDAADAWAQSLIAKIESGEDVTAILAEKQLAWEKAEAVGRSGSTLPRSLVTSLFRLGTDTGNNMEVSTLSTGDVGIVKLVKVNQAEALDESTLAMLRQQLTSMNSQTTYEAYVAALRADAEVKINGL